MEKKFTKEGDSIRAELTDLMPAYAEIARIIGVEEAQKLFYGLRGQTISFNQHFYNVEYVRRYSREKYNGSNIKELARELGYTERRIRYFLNEK